jgi:hypothetical protein
MLTDALFHMTVKVGQRSKGKSAIAKAAYDSASTLHDRRQDRSFNYSRKSGVIESFILVPQNAPTWTKDRAELWNRVEASEKRKDAVLWREIEVSIPRDLLRDTWQEFITNACQTYIANGAICDVSIHCPRAADGGEQPHAHILLTPRALDDSTLSGFANTKNRQLDSMFESGGRHGGKRGDALQAERTRWAEIMNRFLRDHGSISRVDHRSNADRGIGRQPEPKIGETRMAVYRRNSRARDPTRDRRLHHVSAIRQLRNTEKKLLETELEIEMKAPKIAFKKQKQDIKTELLKQRVPDIDLSKMPDDAVYRVDIGSDHVMAVAMRDDSFLEFEKNVCTYYGGPGKSSQAYHLAQAIEAAGYADLIDYTPISLASSHGSSHARKYETEEDQISREIKEERERMRSHPWEFWDEEDIPKKDRPAFRAQKSRFESGQKHRHFDEQHAKSLTDKWRDRGFTNVRESRSGTWIRLDRRTRLQDTGDTVTVHGPVTADSIRAMILNAKESWGASCEITGEDDFKNRSWLEAQRQGVKITNYDPPADIRDAWEREQAHKVQVAGVRKSISDDTRQAEQLRKAASGDATAIKSLHPAMQGFLFGFAHGDEAALEKLRQSSAADIVPELQRFSFYGRAHLDPEQTRSNLKDWIAGENVPPPCHFLGALAEHHTKQGLSPEAAADELVKALRITDTGGQLKTGAALQEMIQQHVKEALAAAESKREEVPTHGI